MEQLNQEKVPCGAVHNMQEAFEQPGSREMILKSPKSSVRGVSSLAFAGREPVIASPPHFNRDVEEILTNFLKYSDEKIKNLDSEKVILSNGK